MNINFTEIAAVAGFPPGPDGRLNLPATQATADALAVAAQKLVPDWNPGDTTAPDVTLTGAGPVWAYLAVAHALHGIVLSLTYSAPNAPSIEIFRHRAR